MMLCVPVERPNIMFGGNLVIIISASIPENTLKKQHNALSQHRVREATVAKVLRFCHINGKENPYDILTKLLPSAI